MKIYRHSRSKVYAEDEFPRIISGEGSEYIIDADYIPPKGDAIFKPWEYMPFGFDNAHIENWSPTYYLTVCSNAQKISIDDLRLQLDQDIDTMKSIIDAIMNISNPNDRLLMPYVKYKNDGTIVQEGRHRARAAELLDIEEIPVVVKD